MNNSPIVSICCITYNQKDYIRKAIESFLMQRTSFLFEIIIHDDASNDGTTEIIKEYEQLFSEIIHPIFQEQNQYKIYGLNLQFKYVFPKAQGKYIAICEGDDYWIDPLKLQKQVDFLEQNSEFGLVHTRALVFNEKNNSISKISGIDVQSFESLLTEDTVSNLTICFRKDLLLKYIEAIDPISQTTWSTTDFPIWLWLIQYSKFKFMGDITAVFLSRSTSISHHIDLKKRLFFTQGIYDIVEFYLHEYNNNKKFTSYIKAKYRSNLVCMYFQTRNHIELKQSLNIFIKGNDWLNVIWLLITYPLFFSDFLIRASYKIRNMLFSSIGKYKNMN